ncbi:MAG: RluA family pseudouridine synthase [Leptospirales bacterium]|nr:RluA family pseudouridine synthase [Leptospirales bacterium]
MFRALPARPAAQSGPVESEGGAPAGQQEERELLAQDEDRGARLDQWLAVRLPRLTRNQWQERIRQGAVLYNGRQTRVAQRLQPGDVVRYSFRAKAEPQVRTDFSILYEDGDLMLVDKPANLPVHPSGIYRQNTLYSLLKDQIGEEFHGHFVQRIDRETSGLVLLAKRPEAARRLQLQLQGDGMRKEYLAIVFGDFPDELDASGWLHPDPAGPVQKKRAFSHQRRLAEAALQAATIEREQWRAVQRVRTHFRRLAKHAGMSLLAAQLFTGRMHQIRATLQSLDFPMVGDSLYGPDPGIYLRRIEDRITERDRQLLLLERSALHAWRLSFQHPSSGEPLQFQAPLPADLAALFPDWQPDAL